MNILSWLEWHELQEKLSKLGFHPDPFGQAICSYKYKNIPVDIMAVEDGPFGPSNTWYRPGFESLWRVTVHTCEIKVLSPPYYLASKFEAFHNRGKDYRTSHYIEDIIYVLDNRTTIVAEIKESHPTVRKFLKQEFQRMLEKGILEEVITSHVHPFIIHDRFAELEKRVLAIIELPMTD